LLLPFLPPREPQPPQPSSSLPTSLPRSPRTGCCRRRRCRRRSSPPPCSRSTRPTPIKSPPPSTTSKPNSLQCLSTTACGGRLTQGLTRMHSLWLTVSPRTTRTSSRCRRTRMLGSSGRFGLETQTQKPLRQCPCPQTYSVPPLGDSLSSLQHPSTR